MVQQGQVFELATRGRAGERLWAYRVRGRGSKRVQRGGFVSEQDAREALERGEPRSHVFALVRSGARIAAPHPQPRPRNSRSRQRPKYVAHAGPGSPPVPQARRLLVEAPRPLQRTDGGLHRARAGGTRCSPFRPRSPTAEGDARESGGSCSFSTGAAVGALRGLVGLERLDRVDVAERREARRERLRHGDAEPLGEHRGEREHLHVAEAG